MKMDLSEGFLLHTLLDHFSDYIYFKDKEGRFLLINQALANRYGLKSPADAVGTNDYDFFTPEHADAALRDEKEILLTGKAIFDLEEKATWVFGEATWVSSSKMPLMDPEGKIVGTFGISRDITGRKNDQLALARMTELLQKKNAEYESDLSIAAELQKALMPSVYPSFPSSEGGQTRLKFCHRYQPSSNVGGDFFEVLSLPDMEAGIFFGDVMGHGVQSALVMSMIRALVIPSMVDAKDPSLFLTRINHSLLATLNRTDRNLYATACYGTISALSGKCHLANAGQLTPLWIRKTRGECQWVPGFRSQGPLGLFEVEQYPSVVFELEEGDSLIFFTDGLMDVNNLDNEHFGKDRILLSVGSSIDRSMPEILDAVIAEALAFSIDKSFNDDVCLLGITLI